MSHSGGEVIAAIEACGPRGSVAVGRVGAPLFLEPVGPSLRHDDDLMPALARAFKAADSSPDDLAELCVSVGPGGFTGLRIAIATAKMLALATGCRLVAVPESLAAVDAAESQGPGPFCVCLTAKGGQHWTCLDPAEQPFTGQLLTVNEVAVQARRRGLRRILLTQPAEQFPDLIAAAESAGLDVAVVEPTALHVWSAGAALAARGHFADPAAVCPLYPREPEAVRLWRQKQGRSAREG